MNRLSLIAFLAISGTACAQGLLGVLPTLEDVDTKPLTFGVGLSFGYDSNLNTTEFDEVESTYLAGSLSADYRFVTERTILSLGIDGGANYYFDQVEAYDDILYSGRIGGSITHAVSDRLSIDNIFYLSYDFDPNFSTGASSNRRSDEYTYGHNNLSINYLWTDRLSTATSFNISGTFYEEDSVSNSEDRMEYGAAQLVRYALTEQTGLRLDYRYRYTDYDSGVTSTSNVLVGGIDHQFDENTMMVAVAGVEYYENDFEGGRTKPYAELGLNRALTDELGVRWSNRLGFENVGIGVYDSNYTYRTTLDFTYQFTEKLSSFAGLSYLNTEYDGVVGNTENLIEGRFGLNYSLTPVILLGLTYSYTTLDSDVDGESYDRQRVNLGINATF